jgi:hypothetical protein
MAKRAKAKKVRVKKVVLKKDTVVRIEAAPDVVPVAVPVGKNAVEIVPVPVKTPPRSWLQKLFG